MEAALSTSALKSRNGALSWIPSRRLRLSLRIFALTPPVFFRFTIAVQRGRTNRVESTTNLANWTTLTNLTGTNALVVIRETNIFANPRRFYRLSRF
jgi:hypothetical protein